MKANKWIVAAGIVSAASTAIGVDLAAAQNTDGSGKRWVRGQHTGNASNMKDVRSSTPSGSTNSGPVSSKGFSDQNAAPPPAARRAR